MERIDMDSNSLVGQFPPHAPLPPYALLQEDSSSSLKMDLTSDNSDYLPYSDTHAPHCDLTMENSNNAIDHTTGHLNSHIFKLPNNELTFNGTLKHLQPIVSVPPPLPPPPREAPPYYCPYRSSPSLTPSSPSLSSPKSGVFSTVSQFPSDCEGVSSDPPLTFAGAVSPLKECRVESPNLFSEEEEEGSEGGQERGRREEDLAKFEECDLNLIKLLEKSLQGVLPPPSVTICQLSVCDILERYSQHLDRFNSTSPPQPPCNNIMYVNGSQELATRGEWPQLMDYRYHGVHYNSSAHSETVDCLLSRYVSRYVGCETSSSLCALPMAVGSGYRGGQVRARGTTVGGAGAPSPSRRLSHLARRRAAFCTAKSLAAPPNTKARQILIDRKKFSSSFRTRRTPGKSKTPSRKTRTPAKRTPGSSQKKPRRQPSAEKVRVKTQPTRETSKRALFLSPDHPPKAQESQPEPSGPSTSRAIKSKRALFGSPPSKRPRQEEEEAPPQPKLQKSLSFGGDACVEGGRTLTRRASEFASTKSDLSEVHKKKLLWAVAEALRVHGVGMSHSMFKQHATSLVRLTRRLCALPHHLHALRTPFCSTSDTLLKIARAHAFNVIRGKSIEELFAQEQAKQVTSTRLLTLETNGDSENSFREVGGEVRGAQTIPPGRSVLQDHRGNIEAGGEGGKLRARRQISFDHLETTTR